MTENPAGAIGTMRERLHEDRYDVSDVNALQMIGQYPEHEANPVEVVLPGPECQGFTDDPTAARETINEVLIEVARLIEKGFCADAVTAMEGTVLTRIRNNIGEYDATPGQRTLLAMMILVERMVERLEAASG